MIRRRLMLPAVIALGSNLGDREATLREAIDQIDALDGVTVVAVSSLVESHAVKPPERVDASPDYLNAVMSVKCALAPEELLTELNLIEARNGRVREERWGDRTLDLDIVAFAGLSRSTELLTLPHPQAWLRPFVIVPWLQIEPDAMLDGHGRIDALPAAHSADVWGFDSEPLFARLDAWEE